LTPHHHRHIFGNMDPLLARAHGLIGDLPGVVVEPYYDTAAIKVAGKVIANPCREPGALAVWCPMDTKAMLVEAEPAIYFDTPHFRNWPAVLVRMSVVDDVTLRSRLTTAWEGRAPKRLLAGRFRV
jgi:hypothetical protein